MLVGHTDNEAGFYEYIGADGSRAEDLTCASRIIAGSRTMAGLPAWHYTYAGTWPNQDIGTGGAYHTSDNGMVFGTHEIITRRRGLPEQRKLSWAMGNAWASFARDPCGALAKLGWPVFDIGDSGKSLAPGVLHPGAIVVAFRVSADPTRSIHKYRPRRREVQ